MNTSGIYCIRNTISGRRYIGSAARIDHRFRQHCRRLGLGKHENSHLQRAWAKHGADAFVLELLEEVADKALLISAEQRWIDSFPFDTLYNARRQAHSNAGIKMPPEFGAAISARMKGSGQHLRLREPQHRWRQTYVASPETNEKRRQAMLGLDRGPEFGRRVTEIMKARSREIVEKTRVKLLQTWIVTSPEGNEHVVTDMKAFANDNGLTADKLYRIARGERTHHRG